MTISLHAATVPSFLQILGAVSGLVDKAETFAAEQGMDQAAFIATCLAEDMLPFGYQVKSTAAHSFGAIEGVRRGVFSPDLSPWPDTFDGLRGKVGEAIAGLEAVDPAELDALQDNDMRFEMGDFRLDFTAATFLFSFSQPNFYFHATTAYDILRMKGAALGKRDFIGVPQVRR